MAMNTVNVLEDSSTGKLDQNQKGTGGAAHVRTMGVAGTYQGRGPVVFHEEADGVAFSGAAITVASTNVFEISGFSSGTERLKLAYHAENDGIIPAIPFIMICEAASASAAAAIFTLTDVAPEAAQYTTDNDVFVLSPSDPILYLDTAGTGSDYSTRKLFGVGVASSGAGVGWVILSVGAW